MTVWKWSGESRYPGAFPPMLENVRRAFSPGRTSPLGLRGWGLHSSMEEYRSANAEAMSSSPVEVPQNFLGLFAIA